MGAQASWANEAPTVNQPPFFEVEDATSAEAGLDDELLQLGGR
jgi:hypothetical protein